MYNDYNPIGLCQSGSFWSLQFGPQKSCFWSFYCSEMQHRSLKRYSNMFWHPKCVFAHFCKLLSIFRPKTAKNKGLKGSRGVLYEVKTSFLGEILTKSRNPRCKYDHQTFPPISEATFNHLPPKIESGRVETLCKCPSRTDFWLRVVKKLSIAFLRQQTPQKTLKYTVEG